MVSYGFVALMPALLFPNAIQSQLASSNCESTKAKVSFDLANLASSSAGTLQVCLSAADLLDRYVTSGQWVVARSWNLTDRFRKLIDNLGAIDQLHVRQIHCQTGSSDLYAWRNYTKLCIAKWQECQELASESGSKFKITLPSSSFPLLLWAIWHKYNLSGTLGSLFQSSSFTDAWPITSSTLNRPLAINFCFWSKGQKTSALLFWYNVTRKKKLG